jgi:hypothetical protein
MARHPDWFARLDAIADVVRQSVHVEWLGRKEIQAIFECSERDSIRLLHKFGATERGDALLLERSSLAVQLDAIRSGTTYTTFLRQRQDVARQLADARASAAARQFRVGAAATGEARSGFEDLPKTVVWRRKASAGPGRFEILYDDGADLMWQLGEFLRAAGANREEFFAGTEPGDGAAR